MSFLVPELDRPFIDVYENTQGVLQLVENPFDVLGLRTHGIYGKIPFSSNFVFRTIFYILYITLTCQLN